jgi:hypothetical protein
MKRALTMAAASGLALALTGAAIADTAKHAAATRVGVTFTGTRFALSRSGVPAGTVTFVATNNGRSSHVLAITGPGLKNARTPMIGVGKSATLTVKLAVGAYMLADPLSHTLLAHWLVVSHAANVKANGTSGVIAPAGVTTTGMGCD